MKTNKDTEILQVTQIKIVLPNKTVELSSDEARKVYEELGKLFINETHSEKLPEWMKDLNDKMLDKILKEKEYVPYPIYIDRHPQWQPPYWEVTCEDSSYKYKTKDYSTCLSINLTNNT